MTRWLFAFLVPAALACAQEAPTPDAIHNLVMDGRYQEAEPLARAVLADMEARFGPHSREVAKALDDLIEIDFFSNRIGDPHDQADADRAIALSKEIFGPASHEMAETTRRAGLLAYHDEDYPKARTLLKRAVQLHEALAEEDDVLEERAQAWNSLGLLLKDTFDYHGAKASYERALGLYEKALGHDRREVAVCLSNLAAILSRLGDYTGADRRYREALAIYEQTVGPEHILVAGCLNNLAFMLVKTGKSAEAAELLQKVVRIATATYGESHARTASALSNLADALSASGQYEAAASYYERAGEIRKVLFGPLSGESASSLNLRGLNEALRGNSSEAAKLAAEAEDLSRNFDLISMRTMPEREALLQIDAKATGQKLSGLHTLLSLAAAGAPGGAALDALIRSRGVVFDEMAARRRSMENPDPEAMRLARGLVAAREELAGMVMRGPQAAALADFQAGLDRARENKDEAERQLAEKSVALRRELASRQTGLTEVARALPRDAALISYVRYPRTAFRLGAPALNPAAQPVLGYLALVLRPGQSQPDVVSLGDAAEVDAMVAQVRRTISQESLDPGRAPRQSEASYRRAAARLRTRIWDPLRPYWKGADRVFIVPDGTLHTISFAALPAGRGYLVESGPVIHYLTTERDLAAPSPTVTGRGMLLVANPAFDLGVPRASAAPPALPAAPHSAIASLRSSTGCGSYRTLRFAALPGAAREAASVAAIWRQTGGEASTLAGSGARKSSVLEQASGKRVLHLATHGFVLDGCGSNAPAMGALENPLLLSGVALAGANRGRPAGEGILTAEEIASQNLDGLEWAVLSACDTALGEIHSGEGVFGLRRAFQLAGTHTVIMSLWPVDDDATRLWMQELYRARFLHGAATSEAVRRATLALLAHRRAAHLATHPLYWGGFLAAGEWR